MRIVRVYVLFLVSLVVVPFIGESPLYPAIPLSIVSYSVVSLSFPHQLFLSLFYDTVFHFPYRFSYTITLFLVLSLKNVVDVRLSVEGGIFYKTFFLTLFVVLYGFVVGRGPGAVKLVTSLMLSEILILEEVSHGV